MPPCDSFEPMSSSEEPKTRPRRRFLRLLGFLLLALAVLLLTAAGVVAVLYYPTYREYQAEADSHDLAELAAIPALSEVFESNGQRYSRLQGEVRYVVPLKDVSPLFIQALLAREDSRFYEHRGVDFTGIFRAAIRNLAAGKVREGASTLTQQLARNTFPLGEDRWRRKGIEALLALRIERHRTKDQILEDYVNRIYYGQGIYGVETASRACFGKSASDLTLSEAAILAGLIRSPNRLSPLQDSRTALAQRDQVLARMEELGMITPREADEARREEMPLAKRLPPVLQEDYATDAILRDLQILIPADVIAQGGLKIYTTLDRRLQMIAQDALDEKLTELETSKGWPHPTRAAVAGQVTPATTEAPYIQGALVAVDNDTGGIRAIVGGRDFKESPYNRAILAKRQIGSTFKPFLYAAAFDHGLLPGTFVDDGPIEPGEIPDAPGWTPQNSDGRNEGLQPAALGLIRSRNTMSIRVGQLATLPVVHDLAVKSGLGTVPAVPAIYLGAFEGTLKDLTAAYTMFPNGGTRKQPYIIERIEDRRGETIYKASRAQLSCLSPESAYVTNELLRDVVRKGTAAKAKELGLTIPAAGKTGTTDDYKDAWFVGYSSRLTCGVWVGLDRPTRIMDRGYGSALALPVWVAFMQEAAQFRYEPAEIQLPVTLQQAVLCRLSGQLATDACQYEGQSYQAQLPEKLIPTVSCAVHGDGLLHNEPVLALPTADQGDSDTAAAPLVPDAPPAARTRATPSPAAPEAAPSPSGRYRMIRKPGGFIFENY